MSEEAPDVRLRLRGNDLISQFREPPGAGASGDAAGDKKGTGPGPRAGASAGGLQSEVEQATGRPALVYDRRLGAYRTLALA